jgi:hypothetical protein
MAGEDSDLTLRLFGSRGPAASSFRLTHSESDNPQNTSQRMSTTTVTIGHEDQPMEPNRGERDDPASVVDMEAGNGEEGTCRVHDFRSVLLQVSELSRYV